MHLVWSTGLRDLVGTDTGFKAALDYGVLYLYSGPPPATPDLPPSGVLLAKITDSSGAFTFGDPTNGLTFEDCADGVVFKAAWQTWSGNAVANGTVGWARLMGNGSDSLLGSTTLPRIDFDVGVSDCGILLVNLTAVIGEAIRIPAAFFIMPGS